MPCNHYNKMNHYSTINTNYSRESMPGYASNVSNSYSNPSTNYSNSTIDNKLGGINSSYNSSSDYAGNPNTSPEQMKEDYNLSGKINYLPGSAGETDNRIAGQNYSKWCEGKSAIALTFKDPII